MKLAGKILFIFSLVVATIHLISCQKEILNDDSIILLGTEEYVKPIEDMLPDTLRTHFIAHFGDMPQGYIPPCIEGEYLIEKQFCHSNFVNASDDDSLFLRISQQHNRVASVELHEHDTIRIDTAFVMGSGQKFTLYLTESKSLHFQGEHTLSRSIIISGEKTIDGIKNVRLGTIVLAYDNDNNPYVGSFTPGCYFIFQDEDGLAENCLWFDPNEEGGDHE